MFSSKYEYEKAEREWKPIKFDSSEIRVIGRLDDFGNVVPVAPRTLSPELLSTFYGYDSEGNLIQTSPAGLAGESLSALNQIPLGRGL
jgi:hypothetical protein